MRLLTKEEQEHRNRIGSNGFKFYNHVHKKHRSNHELCTWIGVQVAAYFEDLNLVVKTKTHADGCVVTTDWWHVPVSLLPVCLAMGISHSDLDRVFQHPSVPDWEFREFDDPAIAVQYARWSRLAELMGKRLHYVSDYHDCQGWISRVFHPDLRIEKIVLGENDLFIGYELVAGPKPTEA